MWKQNCVLIQARLFAGTYSSQTAGGSTTWLSQSNTGKSLRAEVPIADSFTAAPGRRRCAAREVAEPIFRSGTRPSRRCRCCTVPGAMGVGIRHRHPISLPLNPAPLPRPSKERPRASRGTAATRRRRLRRLGHLDCLVNNAAVRDRRPLHDIAADDFRRLIETNLVAQYELSRVAARHMAARGHGRLVFISSMVGPRSFQGDPAYVASKAGSRR